MEQWVKIKQIQKDGYFVSDLGRIKVVKNGNEVIKLGYINKQGYYVLSYKLRTPNLRVHFLVLDNFTIRPEWSTCINHINGIKTDNRLVNLEWSTDKLNIIHAYATGLNKGVGKNHHNAISENLVHEIYRLKKEGRRICDISRILDLNRWRVCAIYNGIDWKYEYKKFFT